jgi:PD-(D/E)XK endonuclease
MAELKRRGDLAELRVAADLLARGHRIAIPFGEDSDYDLIVDREGHLERVQVKHAVSDGRVIPVRCRSMSLTNGRVRSVKKYTAATIDWIAVFDVTTDRCYYVPAAELGPAGRSLLHLRLQPTRSGRRQGIRHAADYLSFGVTGA